MQEHQISSIPIVDAKDGVIGIVAQADLALKDKSDRVSKNGRRDFKACGTVRCGLTFPALSNAEAFFRAASGWSRS